MQNTDKTSSVENIRPSSSLPARRTQVGYLLIAALAALEAGLTASLMAVVLMGVWRLAAGIWQGVTLRTLLERHGGAQPGAAFVAFYSREQYPMAQRGTIRLWFKWDS